MILIIVYLILFLAGLGYLIITVITGGAPNWVMEYKLATLCCLIGGVGGVVYCLRGVYLNRAVRDQWDRRWHVWYYLRPIVSVVCGGASYLVLKAGLLILEASADQEATHFGFIAFAFIAGLNVDKFITKIEDIAQTTWGIEKSRTAKESEKDK